jgi:hypothetical protein
LNWDDQVAIIVILPLSLDLLKPNMNYVLFVFRFRADDAAKLMAVAQERLLPQQNQYGDHPGVMVWLMMRRKLT